MRLRIEGAGRGERNISCDDSLSHRYADLHFLSLLFQTLVLRRLHPTSSAEPWTTSIVWLESVLVTHVSVLSSSSRREFSLELLIHKLPQSDKSISFDSYYRIIIVSGLRSWLTKNEYRFAERLSFLNIGIR